MKGLISLNGGAPRPFVKILQVTVHRAQLLYKKVLAVGHYHRCPPCDRSICSEVYDRNARNGDTGRIVGGAFKVQHHP